MNVLMISADRWFFTKDAISNVSERHRAYGSHVHSLDIVVQTTEKAKVLTLSSSVHVHPTNSSSKLLYVKDALNVVKSLSKKTQYDLIVTQDPFLTGIVGIILKKRLVAKLLVHLHGDFIDNPEFLKARVGNRVLHSVAQGVLKQADAIRVMSNGQKEKLLKRGITQRIEVIATPISLEKFEHAVPLSKKEWEVVITMVGRKDPVKDFDTLFNAMAIVFKETSNTGLYLVGNYTQPADAPLPQERIRLFGVIPGAKLPEVYATSDVVVLSSRSESFGKVLVEAHAAGKPVVTTDTAGGREIVQDGVNGYIVPTGDYKALAKKIIMLTNDAGLRSHLGEQGRKMAHERYGNNEEKIIHLWKSLTRKL
jgi:1,2-diacylglycerol 3-alpha-glucosyltransferase